MPPRDAGSTRLLEAPPSPREASTTNLPAFGIAIRSERSSVEVARRVTRAWLRCHCRMLQERVDAVLLVVSELCTNAVLHGRCESIGVHAWLPVQGELRLEVHDWSPSAIPKPRHVGPESESGRGLFLVDFLITELGGEWGFSDDGSCAWCRLTVSEEER
jgi:anti-sigma regulatory factor (Ser/Thr protein kinase)